MKLSTVIPTLDEADQIAEAVRSAQRIADEVVVVDAGSTDATAHIAALAGARVVRAPRGRGTQLHAGAQAAGGEVLLFLHADARLAPAARPAIERALGDLGVDAGNFRLAFVPERGWARLFSWANHVRRLLLRIYYGDSGLFIRREAYDALGGFRCMPLMEDYELVRRIERNLRTVYLRDVRITASARRFEHAPLKTLATWTVIQSLYFLGIPPERLVQLYK